MKKTMTMKKLSTSKPLPRLTPSLLKSYEKSGKSHAWYTLCCQGYLPAEISLHSEPFMTAHDVTHAVRSYCQREGDIPVPLSCAYKRDQRNRPAPPADWRAAFRSTVMRTGMCLSLTQPMLEFLCAVADGVYWDRGLQCSSSLAKPCNSIVTGASLEKRGLIRRKSDAEIKSRQDYDSHHTLTEAGEAVVGLLKVVGVFIEADEATRRKNS